VYQLIRWDSLAQPFGSAVAYILDHQYTTRDLSLAYLKGQDYHRAQCVAQSCAAHGGLYLLFGNMEMSWTYDVDDEDDKIKSLGLFTRVNLDGIQINKDVLVIPEEMVLNGTDYEHRHPDIEKGGEYMGNEHAEIEQFFKDSVSIFDGEVRTVLICLFKIMLIISHKHLMMFILDGYISPYRVESLLELLEYQISRNVNSISLRNLLVCLCQNVLDEGFGGSETKDLCLGRVALAAVFLRDAHLFKKSCGSN